MEWLNTLNAFIASHQALVVALGVPLVTALAAAIVSLITTRMNLRAQALDRALQKKMWVLDNKKRDLEQLRSHLAEFSSLTFGMSLDLNNPDTHGGADKIAKEIVSENYSRIVELIANTNLVTGFHCDEIEKVTPAMWYELEVLGDQKPQEQWKPDDRFAAVCRRVIWRLEQQLYEEAPQ
jgi:hypothetical protein